MHIERDQVYRENPEVRYEESYIRFEETLSVRNIAEVGNEEAFDQNEENEEEVLIEAFGQHDLVFIIEIT